MRGRIAAAGLLLALGLACLLTAGRAKAEPKAFDYLLPEADTRVYTADEIGGMNLQVANYAKNEIYARHGRKFRSAELNAYFAEQPWYSGTIAPSDFRESTLNSYEQENVRLLAEREKSLSWDGSGYELDQPGYNFDAVYAYLNEDYNILEDLEVSATSGSVLMSTKHFSLLLPKEPQWEYLQLDRRSFEINHKSAREDGFGGWVASIVAFDPDDTEYEEYPNWRILARGADKVYVTILPTDVQFNWEDPAEAEEYGVLSDWAVTLDEQSADNPFSLNEEPAEETAAGGV